VRFPFFLFAMPLRSAACALRRRAAARRYAAFRLTAQRAEIDDAY
jgi:hypothetical protein